MTNLQQNILSQAFSVGIPELAGVAGSTQDQDDGEEVAQHVGVVADGGLSQGSIPVPVTLQQTPLVASLTERGANMVVHCAQGLKACWSPNVMQQQSQTEAVKVRWVYPIHSAQGLAFLDARKAWNCISLLPALPLVV